MADTELVRYLNPGGEWVRFEDISAMLAQAHATGERTGRAKGLRDAVSIASDHARQLALNGEAGRSTWAVLELRSKLDAAAAVAQSEDTIP